MDEGEAFDEVRFVRRASQAAGAKYRMVGMGSAAGAAGAARGPTLYRGCMDGAPEEVRVGASVVPKARGDIGGVVVERTLERLGNDEVGEVRQLHRLLEGGRGKGQWGETRGVSGLQRRLLMAAPGLGRPDPFEEEVQRRVFGPATERLVKRFQKAHGMVGDGIVGPETWTLLATEQRSARAAEMRRRDLARDAADALDAPTSPTRPRARPLLLGMFGAFSR